MTKKAELLEFVNAALVDGTNQLVLETVLLTDIPGSEIPVNSLCHLTLGTTKERVITIISERFTDDLIGTLPNGLRSQQILSWNVVPR